MDSTITTAWVVVCRRDLKDVSIDEENVWSLTPTSVTLRTDMSFTEIQNELKQMLNIGTDKKVVMKVRSADNSLVPLSYLLTKSDRSQPFLIEVANVHQYALSGYSVPEIYAEALAGRIKNLDKRIHRMESQMTDFRSRRVENIERITDQLDYKVQFLDRRLDELTPPDWKVQLQNKAH